MKNGKISQDLWPVKNEKMRNFRDRIWFDTLLNLARLKKKF